jgi:hypothetical protein
MKCPRLPPGALPLARQNTTHDSWATRLAKAPALAPTQALERVPDLTKGPPYQGRAIDANVRRKRRHIGIFKRNDALLRRQKPGKRAHQSGFTRAVAADHGGNRPLSDMHADVLEDAHFAIAGVEAAGLKDVRHRTSPRDKP